MRTVEYTHKNAVVSSALDMVWYNEHTQELYVRFVRGNIAGYRGVPLNTYYALVDSYSVGSYYSNNIKDKFTGLSGDVTFEKYMYVPESKITVPETETQKSTLAKGSQVFVVVEVNGTLKFDGMPGVPADRVIVEVQNYLDAILEDGTFKVRQVIQNFDD